MLFRTKLSLSPLALLLTAPLAAASPARRDNGTDTNTCRKTQVLVMGAGMAGITAANALANASVTDFVIVEYNDEIGGRVKHTTFGDPSVGEYTIELGANWVQGIQSPGGPPNPIWTLAQKYNLSNKYSDYGNISTFNGDGAVDYLDLFDKFDESYATLEQDAGYILTENLQDRTLRTGLSLADWKPRKNYNMQAVEWYEFDFEYAYPPEQSSEEFCIINYNTTFYQYSDENNYVFDSRGYNTIIKGEASTFLSQNDSRLLLNTIVSNIAYSDDSVTATMQDGGCITADYAICTFSLGVLQHDDCTFSPELPHWKREGIEAMQMGTYTKIFLQFKPEDIFWDQNTQFDLYADPDERGWYPIWQSLDTPGFLEGSGIFFVTVVDAQSYAAEAHSDNQTLAEVMSVLRTMYPNTTIPEPVAFMYPRWSTEPWAYGSYSNWPPSMSLEMHQNLRANVGRLYFAGEHTSAEYFGFLQGAYWEGKGAGETVASCVKNGTGCGEPHYYEKLVGVTPVEQLVPENGWIVSSFLTYGDV